MWWIWFMIGTYAMISAAILIFAYLSYTGTTEAKNVAERKKAEWEEQKRKFRELRTEIVEKWDDIEKTAESVKEGFNPSL
jgi:hypothetical protein